MKIRFPLIVAAATLGVALPALARDVPVIPREVLFGNPNRVGPKVSPDGTQLSFLAPVAGVLNLWVGPITDPGAARPVTNDTGQGIRVYAWAYTNQHILFLQDEEGGGNWRLYCANLANGSTEALTPATGTAPGADRAHTLSARIQHVSYKYPHDIVVGLNDRDPRHHDLYVLNIDTGERVELQRNEEFLSFTTDDDYTVRFGMRLSEDGGRDMMVSTWGGDWELFANIPPEDVFTTGPVDFNKTGDSVYMVDSRGRDTAALKSINIETNAAKTLAKDRDADISGGVMVHPTEKNVQAASSTYKRRDWHIVDSAIKDDMRTLENLSEGDFSVISRSLDDNQWIVACEMDAGPTGYYHYDRANKETHQLFTSQSALDGLTLARMNAEVIKSEDRQNLVTYYSLPPWTDRAGKGRPNQPQPMVVLVHGGPWWRDTWGYNPVHQWLANRGYAVLSVNYRGSTGFGKKFVDAGNREWGHRMHADLVDAVNWAVKKKIADPDRVAIMGASYGGYAALIGMTQSPDTFACAVNIAGPTNLVSFLESMPAAPSMADLWTTRVGDFRTEEGRSFLAQRSPITFADQITKPILIGQGAQDPRVDRSETEMVVETVRAAGVPVTLVVYPDEGHGISKPANRLAFFAVTEAFLARHLGGRSEPVGRAFEDSSITIPVGEKLVAGVN